MIDFDGSKELMYEFPKEFQVRQNGKTYPYYKLAKNKIRFMDEVPSAGQLDIVEVLSKQAPVRSSLAHTIADLAFMTKDDVNKIDDTAARLKVQAGELEQTLKVSQDLLGDITAYENANKADIDELKTDTARGFSSVAQGLADVNTKVDNARNEALINASELSAEIKAHETATNPHKISKKMLGVDKVDNTSDADKPISKATQEALDLKADKEDLSEIEDKLEKTSKKQEELVNGLSSFGAAVAEALPSQKGKSGKYLKTDGKKAYWAEASGGGGGTSDYTDLENKPQINGTTLSGNKTSSDLGLQAKIDSDHKLSASLVDGLASVATSGAYSDLTGTPSLATVATSGSYSDLIDKPTIPTVDQTYDSTSANAQSGVAVASAVSGKQDTLVSGTNIKTINNESLLGSGNIDIGGGGASSLTDIAVAGENVTFTPQGTNNVTTYGSLTTTGTVLSNFSSSNYATAPFTPETGPFAWKAVVKVTSGSTTSGIQRAMCLDKLFMMHFNGSKLHFEPSGLSDYTSNVSVSSNTTYYMCIEFDGTSTYTYSYSNDGNTWTTLNTVTGSFSPTYTNEATIYLGQQPTLGYYYFQGSIDLQGCYLEINGVKVWEGFTLTGKTAINATVPSGVLTNAATGSNSLAILGTANNSYSVAIKGATTNSYSIAIGYSSSVSGSNGIAIGNSVSASGSDSICIGHRYNSGYGAGGQYDICIGYNTDTSGSGGCVCIGGSSSAGYGGVAVGTNANANSNSRGIAIGNSAKSQASYAIQLGQGTNNTANTFSVGLSSSLNVQLLDSTGEVPEARMAKIIISGASDPDTTTVGTVGQLYKNTTDGGIFKCTDTTGGSYTWEELGAGGGGSSIAKETYTNPALTASDNYCTWTITHGLNTKDVVVSVYRTDDDVEPMVNIIHRTTSTVLVVFNSSADIAAGAYKAVIIG